MTLASMPVAAGQWQQIGNPFADSSATVCGAGVSSTVFTYDPTTGVYIQSTTLRAGQGAWAYSPVNRTVALVQTGETCPAL